MLGEPNLGTIIRVIRERMSINNEGMLIDFMRFTVEFELAWKLALTQLTE